MKKIEIGTINGDTFKRYGTVQFGFGSVRKGTVWYSMVRKGKIRVTTLDALLDLLKKVNLFKLKIDKVKTNYLGYLSGKLLKLLRHVKKIIIFSKIACSI